MEAKEMTSKLFEVRIAQCPNEKCSRRLLVSNSAQRVKCGWCENSYEIENLRFEKPASAEMEFHRRAMEMKKTGKFGAFRLRSVHRLVHGIASWHHANVLMEYFQFYGVDSKDGRVKRLSEMKRTEPLNVTTLSNYAFELRKEHMDICGYGCHPKVNKLFESVIRVVNEFNGKPIGGTDIFVPITTSSGFPHSTAAAISRASCGSGVFANALFESRNKHLERFNAEYDLLAGKNHSGTTFDRYVCQRQLAEFSNVLARTIFWMNVDEPRSILAFVPFMRKPEDCVDENGRKRSPLVVAWSEVFIYNLVSMVAVADDNISTVFIPRRWLASVWGIPDAASANEAISAYIEFDEQNRCVVANGKYFKPEHMRELVTAFGKHALERDGVDLGFVADCLMDVCVPNTNDIDNVYAILMQAAIDGQLWRCTICEKITYLESPGVTECDGCGRKNRGRMRKQNADGSIEYKAGDHTMTPAPKSWCFMKRKHWYDGREYDNPQLKIPIYVELNGMPVEFEAEWRSGESINALNSNAYELAEDIANKCCDIFALDFDAKKSLIDKVQVQIERKVETAENQAKTLHLSESLGGCFITVFLDDQTWVETQADEARRVIETIKCLYDDFNAKINDAENETGPVGRETATRIAELGQ